MTGTKAPKRQQRPAAAKATTSVFSSMQRATLAERDLERMRGVLDEANQRIQVQGQIIRSLYDLVQKRAQAEANPEEAPE